MQLTANNLQGNYHGEVEIQVKSDIFLKCYLLLTVFYSLLLALVGMVSTFTATTKRPRPAITPTYPCTTKPPAMTPSYPSATKRSAITPTYPPTTKYPPCTSTAALTTSTLLPLLLTVWLLMK